MVDEKEREGASILPYHIKKRKRESATVEMHEEAPRRSQQSSSSAEKQMTMSTNDLRGVIKAALMREKTVLQKLPPTSAYVIHRLQVINKAMTLLPGLSHNSQPSDIPELEQLLSSLSLL